MTLNTLIKDMHVIKELLFHSRASQSGLNQMELFYQEQAVHYDLFRKKLLPNRHELYQNLSITAGQRLLDVGGGTGYSLEALGEKAQQFERIDIVDLSSSLLKIGKSKAKELKLKNTYFFEKDFLQLKTETKYDFIIFSYSLTMISDWEKALLKAESLLADGGCIGVVDFYVSSPTKGWPYQKHSKWLQFFWKKWFQVDHVFLNPEHLLSLGRKWKKLFLKETMLAVPYLPYLKVPSYIFIGQKKTLFNQNLDP